MKPTHRMFLAASALPLLAGATARAADITQTVDNKSWLDPIWGSPAAVATAGNNYISITGSTTNVVRSSPAGSTTNGTTDFPGDTLTIPSGSRLVLKQTGAETATLQGGAGNLVLNGGRLSLGPNGTGSNGSLILNELTISGTGARIDFNTGSLGFPIYGTLRGAGDVLINYESGSATGRFVSFDAVSDYTGTITVGNAMGLDFNSDHDFSGGVILQGTAFLNVDQDLTFKFPLLTDPTNGPVPVGDYSGDALSALGFNYADAGGTLHVVLADEDGDGLPDSYENQIIDFDPNDLITSYADIAGPNDAPVTTDFDSDGASDADEYANGTNPTSPDSDGDGLKDGVETNSGFFASASDTGTDPLLADSDSDRFSDGVEVRYGTDPNDQEDFPGTALVVVNGGFEEPVLIDPSQGASVSGGLVPGWTALINDFYISGGLPLDPSNPAGPSAGFQFAAASWTATDPDTDSNTYVGGADAVMSMFQDIPVPAPLESEIDAGSRTVRIDFDWSENDYNDRGAVRVRFLDGAGVNLGRPANFETPPVSTKNWLPGVLNAFPPVGTRTIRLILEANNTNDLGVDGVGTARNVAFDAVSARFLDFDFDHDTLPDDWETAYGLNPLDPADAGLNADTDSLSNLEEFQNGTNPTLADTDGDGANDDVEIVLGTSPLDKASAPDLDLRVTSSGFSNGKFVVDVAGLNPFKTYTLKRSDDLRGFPTTVETLLPSMTAAGNTATLTDPAPPAGRAFYRVQDQ